MFLSKLYLENLCTIAKLSALKDTMSVSRLSRLGMNSTQWNNICITHIGVIPGWCFPNNGRLFWG